MAGNRDDSAIVKKAWQSRKRKGPGGNKSTTVGKAAAAAVAAKNAGVKFTLQRGKPAKNDVSLLLIRKKAEVKKKRAAAERLFKETAVKRASDAQHAKDLKEAAIRVKAKADRRAAAFKADRDAVARRAAPKETSSVRKAGTAPSARKAGETREERNARFARERAQRALTLTDRENKAPRRSSVVQSERLSSKRKATQENLSSSKRAADISAQALQRAQDKAYRTPPNDPRRDQAELAMRNAKKAADRAKKKLERAELEARRYTPKQ